MDFFGLDIGSASAKLVQLKKGKAGLSLDRIGSIPLKYPGMRADTNSQLKETRQMLKKLIDDLELTTKNVVIAVPEDKVTTRIKWFPPMKEKEVESALRYEAETFIPHPLDKVEMDYQIIDKGDDNRLLVFIVGILKAEVEKYSRMAESLELNLLALEPESVSINRILAVENLPVVFADINYDHTTLAAGKSENIYLTRSVPIGLTTFSRAVKINLGLKDNEADSYLQAYGLKEEELEGRVRQAVLPIVDKLIIDIKQTVLSFQKDWQEEVGLVILSGKGARTPSLAEAIAKRLGIEVQAAEPFSKIAVPDHLSLDLSKKGMDYAVSCGAAARGLK